MAESVEFEVITPEESWAIFDENAQRLLHMSGQEFADRWDAGEFRPVDDTKVMQLLMLRPSGG